jgi:hypothetical protein
MGMEGLASSSEAVGLEIGQKLDRSQNSDFTRLN